MGLSGEPKSRPAKYYHPITLIQEDIHSRPRIPESLNSAFREMGQPSFFDSCRSSLSLSLPRRNPANSLTRRPSPRVHIL